MKRLLILGLLVCTQSFAQDTYKLEVTTNDMTELGVPYVDAQRFICQDTETQKECYERNKPEIDTEKSARIARYISSVKNPVVQPEPTKEQLEADKANLMSQIADLDSRIMIAKPKVVVEESVIG